MNERIQELIKQATECYSNGQERTFDKEKFAELIVKECALVANAHNEEAEGVHLGVGRVIKNYFGVDK